MLIALLFISDYSDLRRFPHLLFWRETYPQTFSPEFLSICEHNSWKKTACYRPLKNRHFVVVCTEKMMDRQYREKNARNIYSNYNQMRAYVECSPNQSKKLYLIDLSINTLRILEQCWPFLYLNFNRVLQFSFNNLGFYNGYHYCMCTNRQLFLWYVNHCLFVCH